MPAVANVLLDGILQGAFIADIDEGYGNIQNTPLHCGRLVKIADQLVKTVPLRLQLPGSGAEDSVHLKHAGIVSHAGDGAAHRPRSMRMAMLVSGWEDSLYRDNVIDAQVGILNADGNRIPRHSEGSRSHGCIGG
jgi:hypothetical protein